MEIRLDLFDDAHMQIKAGEGSEGQGRERGRKTLTLALCRVTRAQVSTASHA